MSLPKRIALAILILLVAEAAGLAILPVYLKIVRGWLGIWPAPTEHFSELLGHIAWPTSVLLIVWLLRRPITRAAYLLSERMKGDNLKFGGFLEITAADFNTMDRKAAVEHVDVEPVAKAVDVAESLLEYAGISESHARALLNWIDLKFNGEVDPEVFLTEPEFAEARQLAYIAFVEGNAR